MDAAPVAEAFERRLRLDQRVTVGKASDRDRVDALAAALCERIAAGWLATDQASQAQREPRAAIDLIAANRCNHGTPAIFAAIVGALLAHGDYSMHLADLAAYSGAPAELGKLYLDPHGWADRAIRNAGCSGSSSSDRAVAGYAARIWRVNSSAPGDADQDRNSAVGNTQKPH